MSKYSQSASKQNFTTPSGSGVKEKLFGTVARDNPDTIAPENKTDQYVGKSGKPGGLLGLKGREF